MKTNYRTREQVAMKLELEGYKGDLALEKMYIELLNFYQIEKDHSNITKDLKRVRCNMQYLKERLEKLPGLEREFLYAVYFNQDIDLSKIMKKYGLKRSAYHRFLDKAIYAFTKIEE